MVRWWARGRRWADDWQQVPVVPRRRSSIGGSRYASTTQHGEWLQLAAASYEQLGGDEEESR